MFYVLEMGHGFVEDPQHNMTVISILNDDTRSTKLHDIKIHTYCLNLGDLLFVSLC